MATSAPTQNPSEVAAAQAAQARGAAQAARDAAEQARDIARAERDAAQARRDAVKANQEAGTTGKGAVIVTGDGRTIPVESASPETLRELGIPVGLDRPESDGPYVVGSLAILSTALVLITGFWMRYRVAMRRASPSAAALPTELTERMGRIENAVESVAVEVERISEGQRFTTRLLSDRAVEEVRRG